MKNTGLVQLLRELAEHVDFDPDDISDPAHQLHSRARQAAEEIEGQEVPSEKEILDLAYSLKDNKGTLLVDLIGDGARLELRGEDDIEWGAIAEERFLVATCRAVLDRFGGGEAGSG